MTVINTNLRDDIVEELKAVALAAGLSQTKTLDALLAGRLGLPHPLTPVVARAIVERKRVTA